MSVCGQPDWPLCLQEIFPIEFCCSSTSTCIALAGNTTLLCCPEGDDCTSIDIIPCDLMLQLTPPNSDPPEVQTLEFDGSLPECHGGCCPWGYSCVNDYFCLMDADQSRAPRGSNDDSSSSIQTSSATVSSQSSSPTATSASSLSPTSTVTTTAPSSVSSQGDVEVIPTSQPSQDAEPSKTVLSIPAIIGIAVGGFVGLLLIAVIWYLASRLRQAEDRSKDDGATGQRAEESDTQRVSGMADEPEPKIPELGNTQVHEME